jgi:hypothetical protein
MHVYKEMNMSLSAVIIKIYSVIPLAT